ncbi:MAG: hypothetical protein COX38_02375 [Candidatus Nealsonbacteria bacterium CG23_combo_of_CG06-09_8_20_14_all_39_25]|uniref:Uncharacterized protein n=2 Tax=Candidatus Nealsoniibacteriota TaxID=1817911 RepID=A0A2G9YSB7_9BACT|nr:MAG: hypothetical protein COX38_02375 [Candidatus Nealsonbacteria bacterium CG23_combo_of_CG06-09_8_20_14_all_39_25]PIZ87892.1 MAG: hypothetical protein COX91_03130 [Candidatus Nealsonbacteria bacterium CG_4_10_14_0_2_um_filter_39_15]
MHIFIRLSSSSQQPFFSEFAAKEKLEIVKERGEPRGRAANYGAFPRRRRRRNSFELSLIYATNYEL